MAVKVEVHCTNREITVNPPDAELDLRDSMVWVCPENEGTSIVFVPATPFRRSVFNCNQNSGLPQASAGGDPYTYEVHMCGKVKIATVSIVDKPKHASAADSQSTSSSEKEVRKRPVGPLASEYREAD